MVELVCTMWDRRGGNPLIMFEDITTDDLVNVWQKTDNHSLKGEIETELLERNRYYLRYVQRTIPEIPLEDFKQQMYFYLVEALRGYDGRNSFGSYFIWFVRKNKGFFTRKPEPYQMPLREELIVTDTPDPLKSLESKFIEKLVSELSPKEQDIIKKYYGYEGNYTMEQLSNIHGVSRERIRQVIQIVLGKLKKKLIRYEILQKTGKLENPD